MAEHIPSQREEEGPRQSSKTSHWASQAREGDAVAKTARRTGRYFRVH